MKFVWDEPKRLANIAKHGMDLAHAEQFDWDNAVVDPVRGGRLQAIGRLGGSIVSIVFAPVGSEGLSIISMRPANAKERRRL